MTFTLGPTIDPTSSDNQNHSSCVGCSVQALYRNYGEPAQQMVPAEPESKSVRIGPFYGPYMVFNWYVLGSRLAHSGAHTKTFGQKRLHMPKRGRTWRSS